MVKNSAKKYIISKIVKKLTAQLRGVFGPKPAGRGFCTAKSSFLGPKGGVLKKMISFASRKASSCFAQIDEKPTASALLAFPESLPPILHVHR